MNRTDFDTAVVRTDDERCDLAAFAWGCEYAHRHGAEVHLVADGDVARFTTAHPAAVIVVGVRPGLHTSGTGRDVVDLARSTGRPVVVVPAPDERAGRSADATTGLTA